MVRRVWGYLAVLVVCTYMYTNIKKEIKIVKLYQEINIFPSCCHITISQSHYHLGVLQAFCFSWLALIFPYKASKLDVFSLVSTCWYCFNSLPLICHHFQIWMLCTWCQLDSHTMSFIYWSVMKDIHTDNILKLQLWKNIDVVCIDHNSYICAIFLIECVFSFTLKTKSYPLFELICMPFVRCDLINELNSLLKDLILSLIH